MKARQMLNWFPRFVLALALVSFGDAQEPGKPAPPGQQPAPQPAASAPAGMLPEKRSPGRLQVSAWLAEVVKLAQAGIDESVMLSYVENAGTFNIGADQLIYIRDLNVPNSVIFAMLQHDSELAAGLKQVTASTVPSSQPFFQFSAAPGTNTQTQASAPAPTGIEPAAVPQLGMEDWASEDVPPPPVERPGRCSTRSASRFCGKNGELTPLSATVSPVREPYAVQLTDPILVYRTEGRVPNLMLIQGLR
jgi:hypothetical protein